MNNDQYQHETFTPDQIDEQIERSIHYPRAQQSDSADEQLINDLSLIYDEYNRQRDRLWQRISAGIEQQPSSEDKEPSMVPDQPGLPIVYPQHSARAPRGPRWQLIFAALAAGLIIASMLWLVGSRLAISTTIAPPPATSVPVDPTCNSRDTGWVVICQHHYEQSVRQNQTINTRTLGTLKFTVDSAYIDGNRAIIKYTYTPAVTGKLYQITDYPQLSTAHGLKFPGINGDQPIPTENETIMTFETANLTQRSGNLSLHFIDEISLWKNVTPTAQQTASMLLQEKHTVFFNFSIKIQPEYKVIDVGQTQTVQTGRIGQDGKLTWERIVVTPSATRLIMSGISIENDMAGYVNVDGLKGMDTFGVYFGKQHVTDQHYVEDHLLQKAPPIFELFYFQPLFDQPGQWALHWANYTLEYPNKHAVDKGYTYHIDIK
ncbi:hypothetical protein KDH_02900 [Dictyobacter sp. S3.2.2.5]|uniref:DUF4179 domain-containing protein n=1 Tax=Dictyobacter halimunensis TaxID=3026934 RepID=A0ABQ6FHC0_9CHLR|nr:hypothetical protein KDH_02900 [Dictyobacter sp. S3.2.2.5]